MQSMCATAACLSLHHFECTHADSNPSKKKATEAEKDPKAKERMQQMFAKAAGAQECKQ